MKNFFIKTYGCQMNVYDSEKVSSILSNLTHREVGELENADIIILNTCHIREKAAEKVYSQLGFLKRLKEERPGCVVGVTGCVPQAEGEEMMQRAPVVDFILGPQMYHRLPDALERAFRQERSAFLDFDQGHKFSPTLTKEFSLSTSPTSNALKTSPSLRKGAPSRFLTIQEGCDKFCTFCVVPYTRGAEFSRRVESIEREAKALVDEGASELTLLGQNVNAYHGKDKDGLVHSLANLLEKLSHIEGVKRLRYMTSHPRDMTPDLIDVHGRLETVMPYLHLPLQSGSNDVLKRMNRHHTLEEYLDIIAQLREKRPDMALSSDFIVGFPGETDEDFEKTLQAVRDVTYAQAYSFKYSPRPGTPAADSPQVNESIKQKRLEALQKLLFYQQAQFNQSFLRRDIDVLCEKRSSKQEGLLFGRSSYGQVVHLKTPSRARAEDYMGKILSVFIEECGPHALVGRLSC